MSQSDDLISAATAEFSFLVGEWGLSGPRISKSAHVAHLLFSGDVVGVSVNFDWKEMFVDVLLVRLENGREPRGYMVFEGRTVRVHLDGIVRRMAPELLKDFLPSLRYGRKRHPSPENVAQDVSVYAELIRRAGQGLLVEAAAYFDERNVERN